MPLAFLFERYAFPARRLFATLAALPLVLPPLVGTVAFIFLFGESGILARFTQSIFGLENSPWSLRGWTALLFFHTYTMYPFFYMLTGAGLRRIDASLAEAAQSLGAGRAARADASGVATTDSLADRRGAAHFHDVDGVVQRAAALWRQRSRSDSGNLHGPAARRCGVAVTETVILAVISLSALIVFQRYEGTRKFAAAALKGATKKRQTITGGAHARIGDCWLELSFLLILVLPVATLVLVSFASEGQWTVQTLPPSYTVANYVKIFSDPRAAKFFSTACRCRQSQQSPRWSGVFVWRR